MAEPTRTGQEDQAATRPTGRGRRRDENLRRAVLAATYELLQREGLPGLGMHRIARRAGVSRTTLYRWWPSTTPLALEAFLHAVEPAVAWQDTGCIRRDITTQLTALIRQFTLGGSGRVLATVIAHAQADPSVKRAFLDEWLLPRRAAARKALKAAQDRHQLAADINLDVLMDMLYAPVYYRLLAGHLTLHHELAEQLVTTAHQTITCCSHCKERLPGGLSQERCNWPNG